jgi:hypothetical protein
VEDAARFALDSPPARADAMLTDVYG